MKSIKTGFIIISVMAALVSCSNVISLGDRINMSGPVVTIHPERPFSRQPVNGKFFMEGTVTSKNDIQRVLVKAYYQKRISGTDQYADTEFPVQWRCLGNIWEYYADSDDPGARTWNPVPDLTLDSGTPQETTQSAQWKGDSRNVNWKLPIDMVGLANTGALTDGQYQFTVTAWDIAGNSDDNSFKTRTVIVDTEPPTVSIVDPYLYPRLDLIPRPGDSSAELYKIDAVSEGTPGTDFNWRDVQYLGKFVNGEFTLQYQIEAVNDVWSIDIRFYDVDELNWDDNQTGENNYYYGVKINDATDRPPAPPPELTIKPNGRITVPDLSGPAGPFVDGRIEHNLKTPITGKTTLHVVVRSMSSSGEELQEKSMGCFVYWPDSDRPWIEFPDAMTAPYTPPTLPVYKVFPNTIVPARAFDDDGVDRVRYTFWTIDTATGDEVDQVLPAIVDPDDSTETEEKAGGVSSGYLVKKTEKGSRVLSWRFRPPQITGVYKVKATVYDTNCEFDGNGVYVPGYGRCEDFEGYFEVLDISMPEIREPTTPKASRPLFEFIPPENPISNWTLYIEGEATAESEIGSIAMVWINPHSVNYAAMSQLSYFAKADYAGWTMMPPAQSTTPGDDGAFDPENPNKVWNMFFEPVGTDPITNRRLYKYYMTVNLSAHMGIAPGIAGKDFLKSQVFVFKATDANPDPAKRKSSMITWSPQGDTQAPTVTIKRVQIFNSSGVAKQFDRPAYNDKVNYLEPGMYVNPIEQFENNDEIVISGEWTEDATEFLNIETILKQNLIVKVKDYVLDGANLYLSPHTSMQLTPSGGNAVRGTWEARGQVQKLGVNDEGNTNPDPHTHTLVAEYLKDTLVVSAELTDIGGNFSEHGTSWLITSDSIRFLRVGSETTDGIYSNTDAAGGGGDVNINVFLEFNKPVSLQTGRDAPVLLMNTKGTPAGEAVYNGSGSEFNLGPGMDYRNNEPKTRQHFTYTVKDGQNIDTLTVAGIKGGDTGFNGGAYPFAWETPPAIGNEKIRMVTSAKPAPAPGEIREYSLQILSTDDPEDMYTLMAGKHIRIDTDEPTLSQIQPNVKAGYYAEGSILYITLLFNESVQIFDADMPSLALNITGAGGKTETLTPTNISVPLDSTYYPQVSDKSILFTYKIDNLDTTNFTDLQIKRMEGNVYDLAGNRFVKSPGSLVANAYTLTGIRVHAIKPPTPMLTVQYEDPAGSGNFVDIESRGGYYGGDLTNPLDNTAIDIGNIYYNNMRIKVSPYGEPDQYETIQFSVNGGTRGNTIIGDWALYTNPVARTSPGVYQLTARQIDRAGNSSDESGTITLNWDIGALLLRVSSGNTNGIYTYKAPAVPPDPKSVVPITLYFRKPVKFNQAPTFTLTARDKTTITDKVTYTPTEWVGQVADSVTSSPTYNNGNREYTFVYTVRENDTTDYALPTAPPSAVIQGALRPYLALESMVFTAGTFKVTDEAGIDVTEMINLDYVNTNKANLQNYKKFEIQTGAPQRQTDPVFQNYSTSEMQDPDLGVGTMSQGQQASDDSFWTTLRFTFDKPVSPGPSGKKITIEQDPAGYRLPVVLTETQRTRYRAAINTLIALGEGGLNSSSFSPALGSDYLFDRFYKPGTNGFTNGLGPDTTTKYILNSGINTFDSATQPVAIVPPATAITGTDIQKFAELFRRAEKVELQNNSLMVEIWNDRTVVVRLTGTNALKVSGADYIVKYEEGFVKDIIGLTCVEEPGFKILRTAATNPMRTTVAKPYIRVQKPVETIDVQPVAPSTANTGGTAARFYVSNWADMGVATVVMDCRSPGSQVKYTANQPTVTAVSAVNWTWDKQMTTVPVYNGGGTNEGDPPRPTTLPSSTTTTTNTATAGTFSSGTTGLVIGTTGATQTTTYQGFRWRAYAVGHVQGETTVGAMPAEEVVYRTALTFQLTSGTAGRAITMQDGDQFWVRGGDTLTSTLITGFPLTNENKNWTALSTAKERAGIRLMHKVGTGDLNNTTWQWVTWDMNASAYITLYQGRWDAADEGALIDSDLAARTFQYGPMRFASQEENWTSLREYYILFPGGHRWLHNINPDQTGGSSRIYSLRFGDYAVRDNLAATL